MKLLVLLAVLGVAAAQYKVYSGLVPHAYNYGALPYAAPYAAPHAATYAAGAYSAYPYSTYPFVYSGLPYAFKPVKAAEEEKPVEAPAVEATRKKRDTLPKTGSVAIHAANAFPYAYSYPGLYSGAAYTYAAAPATYAAGPITYSGFHGYSPLIHSLKKRDTAAAEDQKADDATLYTTYATHPYAYNAYNAYPHNAAASVYSSAAYPYNYNFYNTHPYNFGSYRYVY